jgi:hypothetical protein
VKSDNCGENAECSGKGICFSNASMVREGIIGNPELRQDLIAFAICLNFLLTSMKSQNVVTGGL